MKKLTPAFILLAGLLAGCNDAAPANCDPGSDYVCEPEVKTGTTSVESPTVTKVPVTTTTVVP